MWSDVSVVEDGFTSTAAVIMSKLTLVRRVAGLPGNDTPILKLV